MSSRGLVFAFVLALSACSREPTIDFNAQVRPILNQNCTSCHGGVKQKGGVSFIYREEALAKGDSGRPVVVPGNAAASELIKRIESSDSDYRMPYHESPLSAEQIATLKQWIEEGAQWDEHWAFVAPKQAPPPDVSDAQWARSPLDRFVLAKLEEKQLRPSAEADKAALLRRVSLDLTGLPPSPDDVERFTNDAAPQAYENEVDRLLASKHFGERWAAMWLDIARYADTKGYEQDGARTIWRYRDWLIDAFNRNLPYDQFVIEQLAGDLLPEPTFDQLIATAFHRNTQTNDEGGTDDEEFRVAAVIDRVATTWVALNGVTFNCVQCHSHPYDPIRHDEFYKFLAFFNNTADADLPNEAPLLRVPNDPAHTGKVMELRRELGRLQEEVTAPGRKLVASDRTWRMFPVQSAELNERLRIKERTRLIDSFLAALANTPMESLGEEQRRNLQNLRDTRRLLAEQLAKIEAGERLPVEARFAAPEGVLQVEGTVPVRAVIDARVEPSPGPVTALRFEALPVDEAAARHTPEPGVLISKIETFIVTRDGASTPLEFTHYARDQYLERMPLVPIAGMPEWHDSTLRGVSKIFGPRWIIAMPKAPLVLEPGAHLQVRIWTAVASVVNNKPSEPRRFRVLASSDPQWTALAANTALADSLARARKLEEELTNIPGTTTPIMAELPSYAQRETRVFTRGAFTNKEGDPLDPDVPALFPALLDDAPRNRLTLAQWFVSDEHPLTARVAVNRYWEQLFGVGLVETLEDFGSAGEKPSHPELLDWLAVHFQRDLRWDTKALLRTLVTSATYRQSAAATPELLASDPRNRLLARGPRQRLSAEMVRDQALFASGLLADQVHGPSVMPPQPDGVWMTVYNDSSWRDASGPDRYRRALYTYWRRTSAYPSMLTFDAPTRDVCTVRRIPTNTPLQALVTLNDPVYMEAAQALATRMQKAGADLPEQIAAGFELVAARSPNSAEIGTLRVLNSSAQEIYEADRALLKASGASDPQQAALTSVASAILNLDQVLSK